MIGKELQRHRSQQGTKHLQSWRHIHNIVGVLPDAFVAFGGDDDDMRVACAHFLDVADDFLIDMRGCGDADQRCLWIQQSDGAMFEFSGGKAFGVDVGDLFELECAFECGRKADTASSKVLHLINWTCIQVRNGADDMIAEKQLTDIMSILQIRGVENHLILQLSQKIPIIYRLYVCT
jgi:hypothetical protein